MSDLKKLFRGEHPFISEPGMWIVAGHGMSGDPLTRVPIQGRVQISHVDGKIVNTGEMSVVSRASEAATFQVSYELTPSEDELVLFFNQNNEPVGDLTGRVAAFDDRLISSYASGDGSLTGYEVLHRLGENYYAVTGTLNSHGSLVNLWKLDLVRPHSEEDNPEGGTA